MSILITLISDQSIPNLLFIRSWPEFERYIFITTEQMERKGRCDDLIRVAKLPDAKVQKIKVLPESLNDVQARLEALQLPQSHRYIVHLTGGNKIMALGAYQFFLTRNSEMYYAPIGVNGYEKVFPRTDEQLVPFRESVSLLDYRQIYDVQVESCQSDISRPAALAEQLFHRSWPLQPLFKTLISNKANFEDQNSKPLPSLPIRQVPGLLSWLNDIGFQASPDGVLRPDELQWLTGGWFEEFVFHTLKSQLKLPTQAIGLNVKVRQKGSPNEFDIMFIHNNDLYVIECKSRLTKVMFDQTAYKLAAIKKDLGLQAKSYLFSSENYHNKDTKQIHEFARLRAKHLNIQIRGRKQILNNQLL